MPGAHGGNHAPSTLRRKRQVWAWLAWAAQSGRRRASRKSSRSTGQPLVLDPQVSVSRKRRTPLERSLTRPSALTTKPQKSTPSAVRQSRYLSGWSSIRRAAEILAALLAPVVEGGAVRAEEDEVVHVAHVARHAQLLLHEMVEAIQMDVREELAGQIADRQSRAGDR